MNKIKEILKVKNIQQKELASSLGLSPNTLSQYINEKRSMTQDTLSSIADFLEVSVDFVLGKTDIVECKICGFGRNPLSDIAEKEHEEFHKKFIAAKEKYSFLVKRNDAEYGKNRCLSYLKNKDNIDASLEDINSKIIELSKFEFSIEKNLDGYTIKEENESASGPLEPPELDEFYKEYVSAIAYDVTINTSIPLILRDKIAHDYGFENVIEEEVYKMKLNYKDEKDIAKKLSETLETLNNTDGLMFDGEILDENTAELIKSSIENALTTGKLLAKQKYTPKKYRKENKE